MSIILKIASSQAHLLAGLRHWPDLKLARDEDAVWVRGFTEEEINKAEVRSIPFITIYMEESGKLIPWGAKLPIAKLPGLLWTPIGRALPVAAPEYNHNFFGIQEQVAIRLVPQHEPSSTRALITSFSHLETYINTAAAIRLQSLHWAWSATGEVLVMGEPLPPLPGRGYWVLGHHLLPAGYGFEFPDLANHITTGISEPSWMLWTPEGQYTAIAKDLLQPLSRSSVRLSRHHIPQSS